ncbi:hypothetical protein C8J57DRAFT_1530087 [Mycena rebaudengoi]|nr:hypothetical protein C8J57DRAFT_1530087 [Mycena rebaudengoi]
MLPPPVPPPQRDVHRAAKRSQIIPATILSGPFRRSSLKHKDTLPLYILSANVSIPPKTDLKIAVVWWITGDHIGALSFCNNHLDVSATFSSFVIDGSSTSRDNPNAVGGKGKGFILATQYLFEIIEKYHAQSRLISGATKAGISFHVGEQIGELKWRKSVRDGDMLRVILDDLKPRTPTEYLKLKFQQAIDAREADEQDQKYPENEESKKILDAAPCALNAIQKRRVAYGFIDADGTSRFVTTTTLFSVTCGIISPSRSWRIPGQPIEFFLPASGPARFYHRDQYIPFWVHLDCLSINYHGDLPISSECVVVLNDALLQKYQTILSTSADIAIQTFPDLAIEIALDVLSSSHSEGLAFFLKPLSRNHAKVYRAAFDAAFHQKYNIPARGFNLDNAINSPISR